MDLLLSAWCINLHFCILVSALIIASVCVSVSMYVSSPIRLSPLISPGIPVYQQQLVYGDTELQDENCLAEHGIPSGAQLKLLIAMRGGPIHAQRSKLVIK